VTPEERENVIERAFAAFNADDVGAAAEVLAADVVWHMPDEGWPGPREYHGVEGVWQFRREWFETWEGPEVENTGNEHLPDIDRTLMRSRTRGRLQGIELDLIVWQLAEFRDGRIARVNHYFDEDEARRASGLA
jgi:ketosteroid isomerase-like protein